VLVQTSGANQAGLAHTALMKQRAAYARLLFDVDLAFFVATFV
jgi:hypothetical protein